MRLCRAIFPFWAYKNEARLREQPGLYLSPVFIVAEICVILGKLSWPGDIDVTHEGLAGFWRGHESPFMPVSPSLVSTSPGRSLSTSVLGGRRSSSRGLFVEPDDALDVVCGDFEANDGLA